MILKLSPLSKTWLIDLDGTIVKHNAYKKDGDILLNGVKDFFEKIPEGDVVILLTSRESKYRDQTINFLNKNGIKYDHIIFDLPYGERILINDKKKSGLLTSYSINKNRDADFDIEVDVDESI